LLLKVVAIAALAAAVAVAVIVYTMPMRNAPGAPNVRFTEFSPDKLDIKVGGSTKIVFNVQNMEPRYINDSKVVTSIEPSSGYQFLSIDKSTVDLPDLQGKDARTGEMQVVITATGAPAKEALYVVKGVLMVEGEQSDVRDFELKIRE
jgi:hypothetical protein